ncbi:MULTISPECIES: arginine deiminase family protein [Myxococcus]|uniref:arginine deiminase family protein n=1 Tax=Myxococcus TaxID=32 RepID=UPI001141329A|nr:MULTISPECIES: arginine deiminase family protein [Myxococcus]NOK00907.1 amidinotransferase [Myxococcus xanthus]
MAFSEFECWSESGQLDCVAVFRPAALDVTSAEEAAAVGFMRPVTRSEAEDAFGRLRDTLTRLGCQTIDLWELLPERERAVSDTTVNRVFVRDTAAVLGRQLVTGTAAFPVRLAEFDVAHRALSQLQPELSSDEVATSARIEFGDVFVLDAERLLVNVGLRSDARALQPFLELAWRSGFREAAVVRIPESLGIIHLDLAFNVLGPQAVVARAFLRHTPIQVFAQGVAPHWEPFDGYFASRGRRVIPFEPKGESGFMSNFIYVGPNLILASESASVGLRPLAKEAGIEVASVDIEALERGNGSVRCLTMPLRRRAV